MRMKPQGPPERRLSARRSKSRGLSLIELTIALGVLSVVLLGLVSMILGTFQSRENMRELGIAREAAAAVQEQLKAQPSGDSQALLQSLQDYLQSKYGPPLTRTVGTRTYYVTTFPVAGLNWISWSASSGITSTLGKGTITLDPSNERLIGVTVQADWKSVGRNSTYAMSSMYAKGFYP